MLPGRRRPPPRSIKPRRPFSADLAHNLPDRPQNLIRQLGVRLSDRARSGDPADHRRHDRHGTLTFSRLARSGAETAFDQSDYLLEPLRIALADYLFLPRDFAGGSRHWTAPCQVVAVVDGQVVVKEISQGGGPASLVRRHPCEAWFEAGCEGFRRQRLLRGKLRVERTMRQSSLLADLRDTDTVNAALPEQAPGRLNQRGAILADLFLSYFQ